MTKKAEFQKEISRSLHWLSYHLGWSTRELSKVLKINDISLKNILCNREELSFDKLSNLIEFLEIDYYSFLTRSVDVAILRNKCSGKAGGCILPLYTKAASGYLRNVAPIFTFIKNELGNPTMIRAMRVFCLNEGILEEKGEEKVNLLLGQNIISFLKAEGASDSLIKKIPHYFFNKNLSFLRKKMSTQDFSKKMTKSFFAYFFEKNEQENIVEKHINWKVKFLKNSKNSLILEGKPNEEAIGSFGLEAFTKKEDTLYKSEFASLIPSLINASNYRVNIEKCLSQGDPCYRFRFQEGRGISIKRRPELALH